MRRSYLGINRSLREAFAVAWRMDLAYLFALIVGLGILGLQAVLGSKDLDADADGELHFDGDHDFGSDADVAADPDIDLDAEHGGMDHIDGVHVEGDRAGKRKGIRSVVWLFLSLRFWIFASLGFGLSGTLLSYLTHVSALPTLVVALTMGLVSGLLAAMAFRALRRSGGSPAEHTRSAVGRVGRVIVPFTGDGLGKIRIELQGQSIDLVAKCPNLRIERGDLVVIEDVTNDIAQVSRAPDELKP